MALIDSIDYKDAEKKIDCKRIEFKDKVRDVIIYDDKGNIVDRLIDFKGQVFTPTKNTIKAGTKKEIDDHIKTLSIKEADLLEKK